MAGVSEETQPEENLSPPPSQFADLVSRLKAGEPVDPAEVDRLRAELKTRLRANAVKIARLGGTDGKAAKAEAKKLEREAARLRRPENRGEGE